MSRSPVLGFNHNLRHGGCLFHVQTEDGGVEAARIDTHVFVDGRILHTQKLEYDAQLPAEAVRLLMRRQHKAMLQDVRDGLLDPELPLGTLTPTPPAGTPAVAEPPSLSTVPGPWQRLAGQLQRTRVEPSSAVLQATFPTRDAFLQAYFQGSRADGVFVETTANVPLGATVSLEMLLDGVEPRRFSLRGKVVSRRHRAGNGLKAGVGIEFLQQESAMKARLLAFVQPHGVRDEDRGPPWLGRALQAALRGPRGPLGVTDVRQLDVGGATVAAAAGLHVGDEVGVALRRSRLSAGFSTRAVVIWVESGPGATAGLEFIHEREEDVTRLRALLASWNDGPRPVAA